MKHFHLLSFVLGMASGFLVLFLVIGGYRLVRPARSGSPMGARGAWQQQGGFGAPNTARMAERLGMTEAELQAELQGGKTLQDIAKEKGIVLPAGRGPRGQQTSTSSGSTASRASSQGVSSPSR